MGRIIIAGVLGAIVFIVLISSVTHGFFSRVPNMSKRGLVGLLAAILLVSSVFWLYVRGDLEYALWSYEAPTRPADEKLFVDRVEEAHNTWSSQTDPAAQASTCSQLTAKIADLVSSVANWSGTVATTYLIGREAVLVVRIGQYAMLRTPYNISETGPFIEQGTLAFDQVSSLKSGDPVIFSGSLVIDKTQCIFRSSASQENPSIELLFKFTTVKPA